MVRVLGGNTCAGVTYCSALQAMPGHSLYPRLYHDISALVPHQTAVGAKRLKATHGISDGGSAGNRAAGSRGGLAWSILDLGARQPGWSGYSVYAANPHHTPNDNAGGLLTWLSGELFARRADQLQPVSISGHSRANGSSGDHGLPILRPTTAWHFLLHSGRLHVPNTAVRFEPCGGANQHCAGWLYRRVPIGTSLQPWAIADYRFVGHQAGSYSRPQNCSNFSGSNRYQCVYRRWLLVCLAHRSGQPLLGADFYRSDYARSNLPGRLAPQRAQNSWNLHRHGPGVDNILHVTECLGARRPRHFAEFCDRSSCNTQLRPGRYLHNSIDSDICRLLHRGARHRTADGGTYV